MLTSKATASCGARAVAGLSIIFVLAGVPTLQLHASGGELIEDFEDLPLGSLPNERWQQRGSSGADIVGGTGLFPNKALRVSKRDCYHEAIAATRIPNLWTFDLSFQIVVGARETPSTCRRPNAQITLTSQAGAARERELIVFDAEGKIWAGGAGTRAEDRDKDKVLLGSYSMNKVYAVRIRYQPARNAEGIAEYWINGSRVGQYTLNNRPNEGRISYLNLISRMGDVWFDNIAIQTVAHNAPELGRVGLRTAGDPSDASADFPRSAGTSEDSSTPRAPKILRVDPMQTEGTSCARDFFLFGQHFVPDMRVQVTAKDLVKELATEQVTVLDSGKAQISINTTTEPDLWEVRVASKGGAWSDPAMFDIIGKSKGAIIARLDNVAAKSNGDCTGNPPGTCNTEYLTYAPYQCVDLVKRYYSARYPKVTIAQDKWDTAMAFWKRQKHDQLKRFINGEAASLPRKGDMIFFDTGHSDGHVAIVSGVSSNAVSIVQQNIDRNTGDATLALTVDEKTGKVIIGPTMTIGGTGCEKRFPVLGWLSPT